MVLDFWSYALGMLVGILSVTAGWGIGKWISSLLRIG